MIAKSGTLILCLCSLPKLLCSDNDDYDDLDEAKSTVSSVAVGRKRHMSTSTAATSTAGPAMKYQGKLKLSELYLVLSSFVILYVLK